MPDKASSIHKELKNSAMAYAIGDSLNEKTSPSGFYVSAEHIQTLCLYLRDEPVYYFDFLSCVSGLDHGPEVGTMEVIYVLYSIVRARALTLGVVLDREKAVLPSVSSVWAGAEWHEREIYDLFGVVFENHPDMRRILLPEDWVGHPLRKDYVAADQYHGLPIPHEDTLDADTTSNNHEKQRASKGDKKGRQQRRLEERRLDELLLASAPTKHSAKGLRRDEMLLSIGPQHPATHGVLRLEVLSQGERVVQVVPHIGYLHRCFEKHAEALPYAQIIPYVDRMDYVAAMNSEHAFVMGVETMLGLTHQLPKRVEYIRVLVAELNRIASHLLALGTYAMDIGAATPFLWMMRDREHILRFLEQISGARMLYNYVWIGGLYYDLPMGFEEECMDFVAYMTHQLEKNRVLMLENAVFVARTACVGVLARDMALQYGVSGPMLRASGLRYDLRRVDAYSVYPELDFEIPIGENAVGVVGDCWNRSWVRYRECQESLRIMTQCLRALMGRYARTPAFDPRACVPKKVRPAAQSLYARAENPKGELGFYFRADGRSDRPLRCKARACSFSNLSVLPALAKDISIADLIAILGSIDIVLGEVDR